MARIHLSPPHMGIKERELLLDAFDSNWIAPLGPHVDAFEQEAAAFVGVGHAAALSSGTAALHLALMLAGVQAGDPVITSTLTFAATAFAIRYIGAVPVFVDADAATWTMDPGGLQDALELLQRQGKPAKAVLPVDLYGQVCDYEAIEHLCDKHGVPIIEDAAEALGSTRFGRQAGGFGKMSALSFNGNKIITTSGGGMLLSDDEAPIKRARFLATQAREQAPHYQHETIGYNYRLSNLLAAVGRGQLSVLPERVVARRHNRTAYRAALAELPGVRFLEDPPGATSNAWLTVVTIEPGLFGADREAIRHALDAGDVESRPVWKPMHLQPVFADCQCVGGAVAEAAFRDGLCLPSGSALTDADRARVTEPIRQLAAR